MQVRVCPMDVPISTAALKSAARGSHAARKHLVLATALPSEAGNTGQAEHVSYISVAPELHFGHGKDK
jgi:tRNA splicing endonuclease